jgi:hypothetical protein
LLLFLAQQALGVELETVLLTGQASPDGNGTFVTFVAATLNAEGELAFRATLTGTQSPPSDTQGIYLADVDSIVTLLRSGAAAPNGNGVLDDLSPGFNDEGLVALNDDGGVAFYSYLGGTSGGELDDLGIFGVDAIGLLEYIRRGDAPPDANGVFGEPDDFNLEPGLLSAGLDKYGELSFLGLLTDTIGGGFPPDDRGVFRADGSTLSRVARTGAIDWPEAGDIVERIELGIASNRNGQVAIQVAMFWDFGEDGEGEGPPIEPPLDLFRIYVDSGTGVEELFRTGGMTPDGNGVITNLSQTGLGTSDSTPAFGMSDDGSVVFVANVDEDDFLLDGPRLFVTDGSSLRQVMRQGENAPGEAEFAFEYLVGLDVNHHDEVAFSSTLHRNAVPPENQTSGIFLADVSRIKTLLREGSQPPNGNGVFGNLAVPIFMNNSGAVLFLASLTGTANPTTDAHGVFYIAPTGELITVARAGQPLLGSTIAATGFAGSWLDPQRALAGYAPINDAGQVAIYAGLTDGRQGLFLANVPEPSRELLSLVALLALVALRRRSARSAPTT